MRKNIAIATFTIILLTGCAQLQGLQTKSADKIADLVIGYCSTTKSELREGLRNEINSIITERGLTASVKIDCGNIN